MTAPAYYNEIDPFAAAWLRSLIAAGHIAPGDVDERSIVDVSPTDLVGYGQCHFFAGIGGWSLALRLAGVPDSAPVWTGSCPCQPFSTAGKRGGAVDSWERLRMGGDYAGDPRHLWPAFGRLIAICRPAIALGEQVASPGGRTWLTAVRADMEAMGYAVGAADLCAASVGAPHVRQRIFWGGVRGEGRLDVPHHAGLEGFGHGPSTADGWHTPVRSAPTASEPRESPEPRRGGAAPVDWRTADWLFCRDERWRPVEPGTFPLGHGLSECLVRLRTIEYAALTEIQRATTPEADTDKILRMVQHTLYAQACRNDEPVGMRRELHATQVLLSIVLCVRAARQPSAKRSGFQKTYACVRRTVLRGMRVDTEPCGSSCQWQPDGEPPREHADAMHLLPLVLSWDADAYRAAAVGAHAAAGRVGRLRGYGNAIVPEAAAAFVEALLGA